MDQERSERLEGISINDMWKDMAAKIADLGFEAPRIGERQEVWVPKVHHAISEMYRRIKEYEES